MCLSLEETFKIIFIFFVGEKIEMRVWFRKLCTASVGCCGNWFLERGRETDRLLTDEHINKEE
jgi:hypothetical protein